MPIVSMPNGQEIEFPEGTSPDIMRSAIIKRFPEYDMQAVRAARENGGKSITQDMPLEEMKRMSNFPKQESGPRPGPGRNPLEYQESPEESGRNVGNERMLRGLKQYAPELIASTLVPEVPILGALSKVPGLAKALQSSPRLAKYAQSIFGNALSQGGVAAAFNPNTAKESGLTAGAITAPFAGASQLAQSGNSKLRLAGRLGLAAGGGALGYGASQLAPGGFITGVPAAATGAYLGFKGHPTSELNRKTIQGLEGTEYKPALEASKRLKLPYLTPAEASGNPFLGAEQGHMGSTAKGARDLYNKSQERLGAETESIRDMLGTVYNKEKLGPIKNELYEKSYQYKVPHSFSDEISKNHVIQRAQSIVEKNSAFKEELKNVDRNSLHYWDIVKRSVDDMSAKAGIKSAKNESRIINKAREELTKGLDKVSPFYKEARGLAQREKVREGLEKAFNKKSMTGTNMYKALEDKSKFEKIKKSLQNVPEAQKKLEDMRLVFKNLITVPTAKTASNLSRTNSSKSKIDTSTIASAFKEIVTSGQYDKAAIELITNPKWDKKLEKLAKLTPTEKNISRVMNMFGKALGQNQAKNVLNINIPYNLPEDEKNGG